MKHHLLPVSPANVQWGYFSKKVKPALTLKSGDRATIETLTHHANDDYERMIANDPGAESVFHWTKEHKAIVRRGAGPTEGPFLRGSGEGVGVHLLTGPVGDRRRGARRCPGGAHPRRAAAPQLSRLPRRALFRLQRRGELGFPLSRPDRGAEAARGHHHLRTRYRGRAVRQGGLQLRLDAADRSGRHRAFHHRLSRRARRSRHHPQAREHPAQCQGAGAAAFRHDGAGAVGSRISSVRFRRAIPAAISTTGGSARARGCIIRSRCPARFSRSEIRTPPRATANSAAPPSRPR